jgi:hypothetical protein
MAEEKKKRGRPKLLNKTPKQFRIRPEVIDTVMEFKKQGKYASQDAVIEHAILHAKECDRFVPGGSDLAFTKDGEVEVLDLGGL